MQEPLLDGDANDEPFEGQLTHYLGSSSSISIAPMQIPESAQPCFFVHPLLYYRHCFRLTSQSDRVERVLVMSERFVVYLCAADGRATWSFHPVTVRSVHVMPTKDTALFTFTEHLTDLLVLFDEKWSTGRENPLMATLAYFLLLLKRVNRNLVVTEETTYEKLALSNLIKKRKVQIGVEGFVTRLIDGVAGYYRTLLQQLETARRQLAREDEKKTRHALAVAIPSAVSAVRQRRRSASAMLRNVPLRLVSFVEASRDVEESLAARRRKGVGLSDKQRVGVSLLTLNPLQLLAKHFDRAAASAGHPETTTLHRLQVVDHGALPLLSQLLEPFQLIVFYRRCVTVSVTVSTLHAKGDCNDAKGTSRTRENDGRWQMSQRTPPTTAEENGSQQRGTVTVSSQGDLVVDHTGRVFLVRYRRRHDVGDEVYGDRTKGSQAPRVVEVGPDEELDVTTWDPVLFLPLVVDVRVKLDADNVALDSSAPKVVPLSSVTVNRLAVGSVEVGMDVPYHLDKISEHHKVDGGPTVPGGGPSELPPASTRRRPSDASTVEGASDADGGEKLSPTPHNHEATTAARSAPLSWCCWGSTVLHDFFAANDPPTRFYEEDALRPPTFVSSHPRVVAPHQTAVAEEDDKVLQSGRGGVASNLQRSLRAYEWRRWREAEVQAMRVKRDAWHRRIASNTFGSAYASVRVTISFDALSASHMSAADQPVTSLETFVRLVDVFARWKRDEGAFWQGEDGADTFRGESSVTTQPPASSPPPLRSTTATAAIGTPTLFSRKEVRDAERARRRQRANALQRVDDTTRDTTRGDEDHHGHREQLEALETFLDARDTLETFATDYGEPWSAAVDGGDSHSIPTVADRSRLAGTLKPSTLSPPSPPPPATNRFAGQDTHMRSSKASECLTGPAGATRDALRQVIQTVCNLRREPPNCSATHLVSGAPPLRHTLGAAATDGVDDPLSWEWETV